MPAPALPVLPSPPLDLKGQWRWRGSTDQAGEASQGLEDSVALEHPWGRLHRPDWASRGLIIWPRGGLWCRLRLRSTCPPDWRRLGPDQAGARLALRWWADHAELWVDGRRVHAGDLFDTACRWLLPMTWWEGEPLDVELRLRSPLHDDGALIDSRIELEPTDPADPLGILAGTLAELKQLRDAAGVPELPERARFHVLGHAHLDLAWLWPVADTWRAAERTFTSVLDLMERFETLHFGHSTPALYAWLEQHRPSLFERIRAAMRAGRFEPLNGPWVECDCVLLSTASLLRQFQLGQGFSRRAFPEWEHGVAWLPDSFGFAAGLPAVATATGVRWFCTHKLAWNASHPFPHRLFRWRARCGAQLLALVSAPIGTDGDPLAMERYRLAWKRTSGSDETLWLPGIGDHGGGPTAEMLEQLALWEAQPLAAPQRHGTLRAYLERLEPLASSLPVWRDELYLDLHRGCATSRPDQKRHNRTLERLLREAELAQVLASLTKGRPPSPEPEPLGAFLGNPDPQDPVDWRPLLFQQFHDILPGTAIPEVFEQAEPQWRAGRRRARRQRDRALLLALGASQPQGRCRSQQTWEIWGVVRLQPLPSASVTLRLPAGDWSVAADPHACGPQDWHTLVPQQARGGGVWLQLPPLEGVTALRLRRRAPAAPALAAEGPPAVSTSPVQSALPIHHPVAVDPAPDLGSDHWRCGNGLISVVIGPRGVEQLLDGSGQPQLEAPLRWCRWQDLGEFWDAWDIASDYRDHPLSWSWRSSPTWIERGPLCARFQWRGDCGTSPVVLEGRLQAGSHWLELVLSLHWRQRHELLRLEVPLAQPARRWAADTSGGVIERPANPHTPLETTRWEVPVISWLASVGNGGGGGLAVLLDGPQGGSASADHLGVSLVRGPTWPDPGADNGFQRQRLALMPTPAGWRHHRVPLEAVRFREPLWCHPLPVDSPQWGSPWPPLPPLPMDLRLVGMRPALDGSGDAVLAVQNEGPCRRRLALPWPWGNLTRLDGLDGAQMAVDGDGSDSGTHALTLGPWQLGFWRIHLEWPPSPPQSSWSSKGSVRPFEGGPKAM